MTPAVAGYADTGFIHHPCRLGYAAGIGDAGMRLTAHSPSSRGHLTKRTISYGKPGYYQVEVYESAKWMSEKAKNDPNLTAFAPLPDVQLGYTSNGQMESSRGA